MAEAQLVTLETVLVRKPRFARVGLQLAGDAHPRVVESKDARFRVDDVVYVVNGRPCYGAKRTAWRIRWKTHLSVTVWRRVV